MNRHTALVMLFVSLLTAQTAAFTVPVQAQLSTTVYITSDGSVTGTGNILRDGAAIAFMLLKRKIK
jgi:hypothetical protein